MHLLAVIDQQASAVLGQAGVDGKTNEITAFTPLLDELDLAGCVITADALHTQREHAEFLASKHTYYILVVKKNQPSLYAQVKNLPWRNIPAGDRQHDRGHGRDEHRTLKAATIAAGLAFPHAAQAIRVTRRVRPLSGQKKWRTFRNLLGCSRCGICPQSGITTRVARGISLTAAAESPTKVAQPGQFGRGGVLAERDDVVFGAHEQQCRRRDLVILVANRLLVDHLESERRGAGTARVVRAEGHAYQHISQRLPDLWIGLDEVSLDVAADRRRVGPVQFMLERFFGLRRDAGPVIGQAKRVFQDQVRHAAGVHQREAHRCHAASRMAPHRHLANAEMIQEGCGVGGQQLEAVVDVGLGLGRYQAEQVPHCQATVFPGQGHLLIIDHMPDLVGALRQPSSPGH